LSDDPSDVPKTRSDRYREIVKVVGSRLKTRLLEGGMSGRELARRLGVQSSQVSKLVNGEQPEMSAGSFFEICEHLALDPLKAWYGDSRRPGAAATSSPPAPSSSFPPPESAQRPSRPSRPAKK
jgi:transcriptional regulator with XRE-family HTH domain